MADKSAISAALRQHLTTSSLSKNGCACYVAAGISRYRLINVAPISDKWRELFNGDWTWNGSDLEPLDLVHNIMVSRALHQ